MITPYQGRFRLSCTQEKCLQDPVCENVILTCLDCEESKMLILDLQDNAIKMVKREKVKKQ